MTDDRPGESRGPIGGAPTSLPEKIGRFHVHAELGKGAMATVYLARGEGMGGVQRLFAIKAIHPWLAADGRFIALFLNEAKIAARLHHPNVVPVYDVGVEDGVYFLSMDYVSGETLSLCLQSTWNEDRPFPLDAAVQIVASAAEGLHAAHELKDPRGQPLGVVHRDVAPKNILVGYDGVVRVLDFGIAKARDSLEHTNPGVFRGTVSYMAPEQARGDFVDRRTDVFALGIVLFESTLGERLFKAESQLETMRRVLEMPIPRPIDLNTNYPKELSLIVEKSLSRRPQERFTTTREMSDALIDFLVSRGRRPSAGELETFIQGLFPEKLANRRALERAAFVQERTRDMTTKEAPRVDRGPQSEELRIGLAQPAAVTSDEMARKNAPTAVIAAPTKKEQTAVTQYTTLRTPSEETSFEDDTELARANELEAPGPIVRDAPSQPEPTRAEPTRAEPTRTEPTRAEPTRAEPTRAEPTRAEPTRTESTRAEPTRTEPTRTEPTRAARAEATLEIEPPTRFEARNVALTVAAVLAAAGGLWIANRPAAEPIVESLSSNEVSTKEVIEAPVPTSEDAGVVDAARPASVDVGFPDAQHRDARATFREERSKVPPTPPPASKPASDAGPRTLLYRGDDL